MTLDVLGNTIPSYPSPCPHKRCEGTGYYTRYNLYDLSDREQIPCPLCRKGFTTQDAYGPLDDREWFFTAKWKKYVGILYDQEMFAALSRATCDQLTAALMPETEVQLTAGLCMVMDYELGAELPKGSTVKAVAKLSFALSKDVWGEIARKEENGTYKGVVAGVESLFSKLVLTQKVEAMP